MIQLVGDALGRGAEILGGLQATPAQIASLLVGLGVVFAYPVFLRIGLSSDPRGLPFFHRAQDTIGERTPN